MNFKILSLLFFCACFVLSYKANAQIGGLRSFEFVEIPNHAKVAGLGTVNVSAGGDLNMVTQNPGLLDSTMDQSLSLTIAPFFDDIINTQLSYVNNFNKLGLIHFGLYYQSLGNFKGYDDTGEPTNDFSAGNYLLSVAHSRKNGVFNYGVSLKLAGIQLPNYRSSALLMDIGGIFKHPETDFTAGLVIKNLGFYLQKDNDEERSLPFDIQLGTTFKPAFMPFRFSLTLNRLYQYDLSYYEPVFTDNGDLFTDTNNSPPTTFDKIFQHVTIGTELLLGKNLSFRLGYNHLIRQSLRSNENTGAGGFTFGLNVETKKVNLAYSYAVYQIGGAANFISLSTNFNSIFKNRSS